LNAAETANDNGAEWYNSYYGHALRGNPKEIKRGCNFGGIMLK